MPFWIIAAYIIAAILLFDTLGILLIAVLEWLGLRRKRLRRKTRAPAPVVTLNSFDS